MKEIIGYLKFKNQNQFITLYSTRRKRKNSYNGLDKLARIIVNKMKLENYENLFL